MGDGRYLRAENSHRKSLTFYLAVFQSVCSWVVWDAVGELGSCLVIQGLFSEDDVKNMSKVSVATSIKRASGSNSKQKERMI